MGPAGPCSLNIKAMAEETSKKKPRRKRRSKAEIAAEKAAKVEVTQLKESAPEGFEYTRARDEGGHFVKDDPETPENEAWVLKEKEVELEFGSSYEKEIDEIIQEKEEVPEPEPEAKVVPVTSSLSDIANRFKRRRAERRANR